MNDTKKTILITGGAGALGSTMVARYIREGHQVYCVDSLIKTQSTENIDEFKSKPNFFFTKADIIHFDFGNTYPGVKLDWIINLACPVSAIALQTDPVHTIRSCTEGVRNLLELAKKHDAVFFQASSADVYGEMGDHPFKESDFGSVNSLSPRACYENGKRIAETLCMDYHRMYGVSVKVVRIFNTAGPNTQMTDGRVPSVFIYNALANRDIVLFGDGKMTRCLLHVDDQVEGIDRMMKTDRKLTGPINIGNNIEVTMQELAEKVIKKVGSKSKIIYDRPDDAPRFRRPDISLAHELLNWKPAKTLDELLDDMIVAYKKRGLPESKVLVFAATYYPDIGPAEEALAKVAQALPHSEFHVITSRFRPGLLSKERMDNVTIYRIGFGSSFDKYLLPFMGAFKARKLDRKHHFRFMWSVMASYGGIAGLILQLMGNKASFIIARDGTEKYDGNGLKQWLVRKVESHAAHMLSEEEVDGEQAAFEHDLQTMYRDLTMKQENKLVRPV